MSSLAVAGSFDDCQRLVKEAFADPELRARMRLASANSINVGRLLPQVLYYFLAVSQLPPGSPEPIIATPSGNFGNLTAGLYAKRLGLAGRRFVAATNINDVVPEYLETGVFRPRPSWRTLSNAMDVGNPSNFERIRQLYGDDLEALRADLAGARFTDDEVVAAIRRGPREHGYLLDPHAAVGWLAIRACGQHAGARESFSPRRTRPSSRPRSRPRSGARWRCPERCAADGASRVGGPGCPPTTPTSGAFSSISSSGSEAAEAELYGAGPGRRQSSEFKIRVDLS